MCISILRLNKCTDDGFLCFFFSFSFLIDEWHGDVTQHSCGLLCQTDNIRDIQVDSNIALLISNHASCFLSHSLSTRQECGSTKKPFAKIICVCA